MLKGTKVNVDLSLEDAKKLGINSAHKGQGEIVEPYSNGVAGHYVSINGKTLAIADKYNAVTPV